MLLDNCTDPSQPVPTPAPEKGATEMAQIHRQRVRIGEKEDGTPMIKWVQGKTQDELNDNIVRTYIKHGLFQKLLSEDQGFATLTFNAADLKPISRISFKEYADSWFKTYKEGVLKPTTVMGYKSNLKRHIYPAIGDLELSTITTEDIQQFLTDRKDLAKNTLHTMLVLISEVLDAAVEDKLIERNPAASKRVFIPSEKKSERAALTREQLLEIIRMIDSLDNPMQKRFISLVLFTGMRRGEVLGLRWEDINVEEGMISVSRAVSYTTNQPILSTPKTKNGIRKIPLDPQLLRLLQPLESTGFIIGGETPLTKTVFVRMFNQIREKIDLHGATPHVFRHSYLSMLNQAGVDPKTIQAIGGHGNIMMTFNRYVHSDEKQIALAGKKFNTLFAQ